VAAFWIFGSLNLQYPKYVMYFSFVKEGKYFNYILSKSIFEIYTTLGHRYLALETQVTCRETKPQ
jgi:hypothetical protein